MHMMAWRIGRRLGPKRLGRILGKLRSTRSAVAMMYALMAPLMIASTGVAVDIGYWYQQQTNLQSAADAAALAAAQNAVAYNIVNGANSGTGTSNDVSAFAQGAGLSFAVAAANNATHNEYNLASTGSRSVGLTGSSTYAGGTNTTGTASWTATVTAPRQDFFSHVSMPTLGLFGLGNGQQGATATVQVQMTITPGGSGACINVKGAITSGSTSQIIGKNCGIYGGGQISVANGTIMGATIATGQSSVSASKYFGYIGTTTKTETSSSTGTNVQFNQSAPTDALEGMNSSDTLLWDAAFAPPPAPSLTAGLCTKGTCTPGSYTSLSGDTVFNSPAPGSTYLSGSLSASSATVNGNFMYAATGATVTGSLTTVAGSASINCGTSNGFTLSSNLCFTVNAGGLQGTTTTNASTANFAAGTYFLNGPTTTKSGVTTYSGYGLTLGPPGSSTATLGGGNWFVNGGMVVNLGAGPTVTLNSGLYDFEGYSGAPSAFGFSSIGTGNFVMGNTTSGSCPTSSTTAPAAATYYFSGGLQIGLSHTTLCSGVYYIRNGTLNLAAAGTLTGTNVTFILQGTANFVFSGGAPANLTAPTPTTDPDCVPPNSYPEADYEDSTENKNSPPSGYTGMPYDGTNGHGICGVLIYQDRNDSAEDKITSGSGSTLTGAVYIPDAELYISAGGSFNITNNTTGLPGLSAASLDETGNGILNVTADIAGGGSGSSGGGTPTITGAVYFLTN